MGNFKEIIGHGNIIDFLQKSIEMNKVSHAYILNGAKGTGKKKIADAFAMALQCEQADMDGCLECHSCKQMLSDNHPDVIRLVREKENSIGVDEIRTQINADVAIKPYNGKYKIYMIEDAHLMTAQAQNALLKTIEEPPEYVIIILMTSDRERLLPTILSRCIALNLRPVNIGKIKDYLMKEYQIPDYKAQVCAAFSQGNVGRAIKLAKSDDFNDMKDMALKLVRYIRDMQIYEMIEYLKQIQEKKMDLNEYLDLLLVWYRDVLLFKTTSDGNRLVFKEEIPEIQRQASHSSYQGIERIIEAIDTAKTRLEANVNVELTLELMLAVMKEN